MRASVVSPAVYAPVRQVEREEIAQLVDTVSAEAERAETEDAEASREA
jgi:hypothetical protein